MEDFVPAICKEPSTLNRRKIKLIEERARRLEHVSLSGGQQIRAWRVQNLCSHGTDSHAAAVVRAMAVQTLGLPSGQRWPLLLAQGIWNP